MDELPQLESALTKADAAGDTEGAKVLADHIRSLRASSKSVEKPAVTTGEKIAGFPLTRAAAGAVSPLVGAAQLGAHAGDWLNEQMGVEPVVSPWIDKQIQEFESAKHKGMDYWAEKTGITAPSSAPDWLGLAGTVAGGGLATKGLPIAKTSMDRIKQGAKLGTTFGATTPITTPTPDFAKEKAAQTGLGLASGTILPTLMEAGRGVGKVGGEFLDLLRPSGPGRILSRYQREIIGEPQIPAVQRALFNVETLVKGSQPTAAEAMVGVPGGSPIQAHQKAVAAFPGGPSAEFGARATAQDVARDAAWTATDGLTTPMREAALSAANAKGGIPIPRIQAEIYDLSQRAGLKGSSVVQSTLEKLRTKIAEIAGTKLKVDANDLYTIRKELGTTIAQASKETANFDKKVTGGLLRDIQHIIDDSIESAGGTGWKAYLSTYAKQAQRFADEAERYAARYKPPQPTSLTAPAKSAEFDSLPHLLSRPLVIGNYLIGLIKGDIEPAIQKEAARRYLNPGALLEALGKKPEMLEPEVWDALIKSAVIGGATETAKQTDLSRRARSGAQALGVIP